MINNELIQLKGNCKGYGNFRLENHITLHILECNFICILLYLTKLMFTYKLCHEINSIEEVQYQIYWKL